MSQEIVVDREYIDRLEAQVIESTEVLRIASSKLCSISTDLRTLPGNCEACGFSGVLLDLAVRLGEASVSAKQNLREYAKEQNAA
ncbi:MAG: hypothetical protein H6Q57_1396 [Geobacteraceae bacterium]|jgi:hypothetical protein|nr:hypothetical protein [Geobacteraceae bacterium]